MFASPSAQVSPFFVAAVLFLASDSRLNCHCQSVFLRSRFPVDCRYKQEGEQWRCLQFAKIVHFGHSAVTDGLTNHIHRIDRTISVFIPFPVSAVPTSGFAFWAMECFIHESCSQNFPQVKVSLQLCPMSPLSPFAPLSLPSPSSRSPLQSRPLAASVLWSFDYYCLGRNFSLAEAVIAV